MFKNILFASCLAVIAVPAHATCIIFPCKIKPDPEITFTPKTPPQVPMGCAYRMAAAANANAGGICPAGLQPVQVGGMVSCGVPVAGEVCHEPPRVKPKVHKRMVCPEGVKGCYTTN
ncbi:hypothetical protein [Cognatishimia activa]|uniref:Secreted protein n=1 Tax=Cognatishimia activa TaxID=1715691 RepID=A0A975EQ15_9RHOB|nr:hypothetical protein [Cognatishimia activa]QTN36080.1 hypothetical protein HZ995_00680 [Cognatishimia activa]